MPRRLGQRERTARRRNRGIALPRLWRRVFGEVTVGLYSRRHDELSHLRLKGPELSRLLERAGFICT